MDEFNRTRSEYMKIMFGNKSGMAGTLNPQQVNDVGTTSFDVASMTDDEINTAVSGMANTQYANSGLYKSIVDEQQKRNAKKESEEDNRNGWQKFADFWNGLGTSITEGLFNVVDDIWDFTIGTTAGIFGGGYFGAKNDFVDWAAQAMTDDRWVKQATRATDMVYNIFNLTNYRKYSADYWTDWSEEGTDKQVVDPYKGFEWERKTGNFVGEIIPSLILAYFTGGSSIAAQAAVQGGVAFAKGYGRATSNALNQGGDFQKSSAYGAVEGAISGAISAGSVAVGGTLSSYGSNGAIAKAGHKIGQIIGNKFGKEGVQVVADKASTIVMRSLGSAGSAAVQTAFEPALQMIYDDNAWYNAYGTEENRKRYGAAIGKSALVALAGSAIVNTGKEVGKYFSDVFKVTPTNGQSRRSAAWAKYKEDYFKELYSSEILKSSLTKEERKEYVKGLREYSDMKDKVDDIQEKVSEMVKNKATDEQITEFIKKEMPPHLMDDLDKWADKYGATFSRISYKVSKYLERSNEIAQSNEKFADSSSYKALSSISNMLNDVNSKQSLKAKLINVMGEYASAGGKGTIIKDENYANAKANTLQIGEGEKALEIGYGDNSDSVTLGDPNNPMLPKVEIKQGADGKTILNPKNVNEMKTVASIASKGDEQRNVLPKEMVLPLKLSKDFKATNTVTVDISSLNAKQIEKLSELTIPDFKTDKSLGMKADLGEGKSLVLSYDGKDAFIVDSKGKVVKQPQQATIKAQEAEQEAEQQPLAIGMEEKKPEPKPLDIKAEPWVVKQAANAKDEGKVYSLSSSNGMVNAVKNAIAQVAEKHGLGGENGISTKLQNGGAKSTRDLYNSLNLGTEEQQTAAKEELKNAILDAKVSYKPIEGEEGDTPKTKTDVITVRELLGKAGSEGMIEFENAFEEAYKQLVAKGDETKVEKIVETLGSKIDKLVENAKETRAATAYTARINRHATKLVDRYGHNAKEDFGPGFDFDTKGYQVLVSIFEKIKMTQGGNSYTASSVHDALTDFVNAYKKDNYKLDTDSALEADIDADSNGDKFSPIFNQGVLDNAKALLESIEENNKYTVNKYSKDNPKLVIGTKTQYRALNSEQLGILNDILDTIEEMPNRYAKNALEAKSSAISAYNGVSEYIDSRKYGTTAWGKALVGIGKFVEAYGDAPDALAYQIGNNEITDDFHQLYLGYANKMGQLDEWQGKINQFRKELGIKPKMLNAKNAVVKDINGKGIENNYLVGIYLHLKAGEDSNNAKYIRNDTVYITDEHGKLAHIADLRGIQLSAVEDELKKAGLLDYANKLSGMFNGELKEMYDKDYLSLYHIANSNSVEYYYPISLASGRANIGHAIVKEGVIDVSMTKDRVKSIPKGTHLLISDPESVFMRSASRQANIHFLKEPHDKLEADLSTPINDNGRTVKSLLYEKIPNALKLIERMDNAAFGINPYKGKGKIASIIGNSYVDSLISANLGTILKQSLSIFNSIAIRIGSFFKALVRAASPSFNKNIDRLVNNIKEKFPLLRIRGNRNEAVLGNTATDKLTKAQKLISDIGGAGIKFTDSLTMTRGAVGVLAIQGEIDGYGKVGTPGNDKYVYRKYVEFYPSQVNSDLMVMSGARAGEYGGVGKLTSFMTGAAQGQLGALARGAQLTAQFHNVSQEDIDNALKRAKENQSKADEEYKKASDDFEEAKKKRADGDMSKEEFNNAKDKFKSAADEKAKADGAYKQAESNANAYRQYKEAGGAKGGVMVNRLAGLLVAGVLMTGVNMLTERMKGQKEWNEFNAGDTATEVVLNSFVSWVPIARDLVNAFKGYDMEVPEYAMITSTYNLAKSLSEVIKNPSDSNARSLLRQAIETASYAMGIPANNLYKYVYGIIKTFDPATALKMKNVLYGASKTKMAQTAAEYAKKGDLSTASNIYQGIYQLYKTGDISHEQAVEESRLVSLGYSPVAKSVPDYYVNDNGDKVNLTDEQKKAFVKAYGNSNKAVSKIVKSSAYQKLGDEAKAKIIKRAYDAYYDWAKSKVVGTAPSGKVAKLLAYTGGNYDIAMTLLLIQQVSEMQDTKLKTKKEQAVALVNRQTSMTVNAKLLALVLMGYGVSESRKRSLISYLRSLGMSMKEAEEFVS